MHQPGSNHLGGTMDASVNCGTHENVLGYELYSVLNDARIRFL
jgi:hypothetical protein